MLTCSLDVTISSYFVPLTNNWWIFPCLRQMHSHVIVFSIWVPKFILNNVLEIMLVSCSVYGNWCLCSSTPSLTFFWVPRLTPWSLSFRNSFRASLLVTDSLSFHLSKNLLFHPHSWVRVSFSVEFWVDSYFHSVLWRYCSAVPGFSFAVEKSANCHSSVSNFTFLSCCFEYFPLWLWWITVSVLGICRWVFIYPA